MLHTPCTLAGVGPSGANQVRRASGEYDNDMGISSRLLMNVDFFVMARNFRGSAPQTPGVPARLSVPRLTPVVAEKAHSASWWGAELRSTVAPVERQFRLSRFWVGFATSRHSTHVVGFDGRLSRSTPPW